MRIAHIALSFAMLVACEASKPPPLAIPQSGRDELTADDYDVMSAVLDGIIRPEYHRSAQRGQERLVGPKPKINARFLVFDATTPHCNPETLAGRHTLVGCIDPQLSLLEQIPPATEAVRRRGLFLTRNSRSIPISRSFGEDVVLVPSAKGDSYSALSEFRRGYPLGDHLVVFSAPVYPTSGIAVIFYRAGNEGYGFVSLARVGDRWSIESRNGRVE
jgi:hypothetical protein